MTARMLPPTGVRPSEWRDFAACAEVDGELFFPDAEKGWRKEHDAVKVCNGCPLWVKAECAGYAIRHRIDDGIWGGLNGKQRTKLRKRGTQKWAPLLATGDVSGVKP